MLFLKFKTNLINVLNNFMYFIIIINIHVFVLTGGLKKSRLIDSHIIDHYVPFLPLEKKHVKQCIEAELRHQNKLLDSDVKK